MPWAPTLTILLVIGGVIMIRFSDFTLAAADTPSEQDATSVAPEEASVEDSLLPQIVYRGSVHGSRGTLAELNGEMRAEGDLFWSGGARWRVRLITDDWVELEVGSGRFSVRAYRDGRLERLHAPGAEPKVMAPLLKIDADRPTTSDRFPTPARMVASVTVTYLQPSLNAICRVQDGYRGDVRAVSPARLDD